MQKHLMAPAIATAMALSLGIQTSTARAQEVSNSSNSSSSSTAKMPESSGQQELSLADILDLRMTAIASGTLKPLNKTPAVATVITAADIKAMGIRTWAEAIDTVPGLHIATGTVYGEKILIRGIASFFNPEVLVMINGVPTTSIVRGDRNGYRNLINLSAVSRIEIIRGPGSALY
jgi:iron complex outermembrane receptor protein